MSEIAPDEILARSEREFDAWSRHFDEGLWAVYFRAAHQRAVRLAREHYASAHALLDLGCGTGGVLAAAETQALGRDYVGLDLSLPMLRVAHGKAARRPTGWAQGSGQGLPFRAGAFDLVFCLNAFHHLPDQAAALAEIRRVLRPGGGLILMDPSRDGPVRAGWVWILDRICDEVGIAKYRKRPELRRMLRNAGFEIDRMASYLHVITITAARAA